ncbi:MAG: AEC family transporter [Acidaminococcus sp.]|jgi:predicted permease|nr:AEC family transporter [Acidaminococcus sp.]MCI2100992.1 AEC family transporter [Acidaminococcus sp.]MCI2117467.1 AEC family transporter [Acidaminococcus sp.]
MLVLQQMIIFVIIMVVGAVARKHQILTPENQPQITKLVLNIAYPAIILSGVTGDGPHMEGMELARAFGVIVAMLAILLICARILPKVMGFKKAEQGIVNVMFVFTNVGFMGVPMIDGIYGKDALIYMTVLLIPFNLLFFSYVIQTIKGGGERTPFQWKSLVNPGMISCFLAIILYLSNLKVPYIIAAAVRMIGSMTGPLAMMLLGSFLLDSDWKQIINRRIVVFTIIKMLILPIAVTLLLKQFVDNTYLLAVCMAALATPSGNVIPLLAALYNKEGYPVSVQGVAVTTGAAVVTMPVVALVTGLG